MLDCLSEEDIDEKGRQKKPEETERQREREEKIVFYKIGGSAILSTVGRMKFDLWRGKEKRPRREEGANEKAVASYHNASSSCKRKEEDISDKKRPVVRSRVMAP